MKIENMTLRDYFAAKAMNGLTANPQYFDEIGGTDNERTARYAYAQADAMLAVREQEKTNQCGETCERAKLCAVCAAPLEQETPDQDGPGEEDGPWAEGWEAGVPGSYGYDCLERFAAVEQPGAKPYTDADGWVELNGGKCPVPGDTVVQVKLRDNLKGTNHACRYRWTRICNYDDIIAYRVAQEGGAA